MRIKTEWQLKQRGKGKKRMVITSKEMFSKSEKKFLDQVETIYGIEIERQFPLSYRFYDGRYKEHLFEIDGEKWHSSPVHKKRDSWKNKLAVKFGFNLHRIKLNSLKEVPIVLEENKELLEGIFKK